MVDYKTYKVTLGAGALIFHQGQVLLVQVNYGRFKGGWILPGGYVEPGEYPHEAVVREVKEETGQDCRILGLLGMRHRREGDDTELGNIYMVFRAELLVEPKAQLEFSWPQGELMDVRLWPIAEALRAESVRPQTRHFIEQGDKTPLLTSFPTSPYADVIYTQVTC